MSSPLTDEKLWSWIDRGSPELDAHLAAHPEDLGRAQAIGREVDRLRSGGGPPLLPAKLGNYRLERFLGSGGMGSVYQAVEEVSGRQVAIKILRGDLGPREKILRREAEALARLEHPHIARLYAAGGMEDGRLFLALELVEGRPLDRAAADLPLRPRVELFAKVCRAVAAAHDRGVIHRDLKPSNVLVDERGEPKLVDLGLARFLGGAGPDATGSTVTGVVGTLAYMSPEQTAGDPVGPASDVWSLGVILYEILGGRRPHAVEGRPLAETVRSICEEEAPLLGRLDPRLRGPLETIAARALAKEPKQRYPSAAELALDLERYLAGRTVRARRPGFLQRVGRLARRRKAAVVAVGAALLAGVLGAFLLAPRDEAFAGLRGRGYPKLSPFERVRWEGDIPQVLVGGNWYELVALNGLRSGLLVEYPKQTAGPLWMKRFSEDLVEVLARLGRPPSGEAALVLRDLRTGELLEKTAIPFTEENRQAILDDRNRCPWTGLRWLGDRAEVEVDGVWQELLSIEGVSMERLAVRARERFGHGWQRHNWQHHFAHTPIDALTELGGRTPPDTIELELRNPASGRVQRQRVPLTEENGRASAEFGFRKLLAKTGGGRSP